MAPIRSQTNQIKSNQMKAPTDGKISDSKISRMPARIVCQYTNPSEQIQVICISRTSGMSFEKAVMPQQQIVFEAPSESVLEVRTGNMVTAVVADRIPCIRLRNDISSSKSDSSKKSRTKRKKTARKRANKRVETSPFKQLSA